jgi:hypothetical protein
MTNDICLKGFWPPEAKVDGGFWESSLIAKSLEKC